MSSSPSLVNVSMGETKEIVDVVAAVVVVSLEFVGGGANVPVPGRTSIMGESMSAAMYAATLMFPISWMT